MRKVSSIVKVVLMKVFRGSLTSMCRSSLGPCLFQSSQILSWSCWCTARRRLVTCRLNTVALWRHCAAPHVMSELRCWLWLLRDLSQPHNTQWPVAPLKSTCVSFPCLFFKIVSDVVMSIRSRGESASLSTQRAWGWFYRLNHSSCMRCIILRHS